MSDFSEKGGNRNVARGTEEENKDVDLTSFNFLGNTKHDIPAYVNILEISRQFGNMVDKEPEFKSQLHLIRGSPNYSLYILPSNGAHGKEYSVTSLEFLKPGTKENSLYAEFNGGIMIHVQFKHPEHFIYFKKILTESIRLRNDHTTHPFENVPPTKICDYKVKRKDLTSRLVRNAHKLSGVRESNVSGLMDGGLSRNLQFYEINSLDWMPDHVSHWLDHIFLQTERFHSVVSVLTFLKSEGLWDQFIEFFYVDNGNTEMLLHEMRKFQNDLSKVNPKLVKVFHNRILLRTIRSECNKLKRRNGMFNINYALVLMKRLAQMEKLLKEGTFTLSDIVDNLKNERRYWWSVEDCRDHILAFLVFRKEFNSFVQEMEVLFFENEKEKFEPIIGVDWDHDDQPLLIPPEEWNVFLKEFNKKHFKGLLKLEVVSYRLHMAVEQNKQRKLREEYMDLHFECSEEVKNMEMNVAKFDQEIMGLKSRIERLQKSTNDLMEKKGMGKNSPVISKMEKLMERQKTKLDQVEKDRNECMSLINEKKCHEIRIFTQHDTKLGNLNNNIYQMTPESIDDGDDDMDLFMESKERRMIITEFLQEKISRIGKEEGMKEFTVKLVMSILRGHAPAKWQRKLLSTLDKFWTPQFCKWGFIHANVQISNVGFHWLSSGLVMVSDLSVGKQYEELLAVDCYCPLLINVSNIYERITKLAEEIIRVNINKEYTLINYWGKEGKLNCQEFTDQMITALNSTDYFPVVKSYIQFLKGDLMKISRQKTLNLRYLDMNSIPSGMAEFEKKFGVVVKIMEVRFWDNQIRIAERLKQEEEKWKAEGGGGKSKKKGPKPEKFNMKKVSFNKNRIYFNTHGDVDEFYRECLDIDKSFELNYPGIFQLLKAFDRAFWMRTSEVGESWEEENIRPGKRGCPFTYKEKREDIKQNQIFEEEEEESEGEN